MRVRVMRLAALVLAVAVLAQVLIPALSVDTYAAYTKITSYTDNAVDKTLYMVAVEMCLTESNVGLTDLALRKNVVVGDKLTSIFTDQDKEVFVGGAVAGTSQGNIRCTEALKGLVGDITITEAMLGTSAVDILSNVYLKTGLAEKTLRCSYPIANWGDRGDATGLLSSSNGGEMFYWPQGFVGTNVGGGVPGTDFTSAQPITIIYNDEGFVGLDPADERLTQQFVDDYAGGVVQRILKPGQDTWTWCRNVIEQVGVHNLHQVEPGTGTHDDIFNQSGNWSGDTIGFTQDNTPLNEWGIHDANGNDALLGKDSTGRASLVAEVGEREAGVQYTRTGSSGNGNAAVQAFLGNLRELLFAPVVGGARQPNEIRSMDAMTYLGQQESLAYMFYGRYLFNGDGQMPYSADGGGCGAVTVLADDKVSLLPLTEWDGSQVYASDTQAYASSSAGEKTAYRSSWASVAEHGVAKVSLWPGDNMGMMQMDCKDVARNFNAATASSSRAKEAVLGYMNVATVNDDGSVTAPDGTVVQAPGQTPVAPGQQVPNENEREPSCFDGGGSLGWLLCGMMDAMAGGAVFIYDKMIEPFLATNATLFDPGAADQGAQVFTAWQMFQGIANIVFIILLLVVIFSQLTGVGIDNYGIKRILPKLIIAALLVNLSYVICQLLVDISNVVGYGARAMFDGMAEGITVDISIAKEGGGVVAQTVSGTVSNVFVTLALVVAAPALLAFGPGLILPALLGMLSALIGIVFTFILLGVRQAGVVLLVVISPLAFVCYMLPNTKSLFDKWRKMFQGLLMLFPICGLLIGAGSLASRILLSTNSSNFFMVLTAMLLNIVPLFFLPTLLKGAFAAMGNIGTKISGIGRGLSGGIGKTIKSSDGYKEKQAQWRTGVDADGNVTRLGKLQNWAGSKFGKGYGRRRARSLSGVMKTRKENIEADNMQKPGYVEAVRFSQDRAAADEAAKMARLNDPDYQLAYEKKQEAAREDEELKTQEALITQDPDMADDLNKLEDGLKDAIIAEDTMKIKAYQNVLTTKGEAGRQRVHNAMKRAEAAGPVGDAARRAYSSNIMNKWAQQYKDNSRSTYDYASKNMGAAAAGTLASYEGRSVGSLKQEQMAAMDEAELGRYMENAQGMNERDRKALQALAYETLNNKNLSGSLKGGQREYLEAIAAGEVLLRRPNSVGPDGREIEGEILRDASGTAYTGYVTDGGGNAVGAYVPPVTPEEQRQQAMLTAQQQAAADQAAMRTTQQQMATDQQDHYMDVRSAERQQLEVAQVAAAQAQVPEAFNVGTGLNVQNVTGKRPPSGFDLAGAKATTQLVPAASGPSGSMDSEVHIEDATTGRIWNATRGRYEN